MAGTRNVGQGVRKEAAAAAGERGTRDRVRDLTVRALRDRKLDRAGISSLVHHVLAGASAAVDGSIPSSRRSVLRQVFDGLEDAFQTVTSAGASTARSVRQRGRTVAGHAVPVAAKRIRSANDEFLRAVSVFAKQASSELGEELDSLVRRARRTGGRVAESAREVGRAADGRLGELTGETARAGVAVVRRAAGGLALAASGLLQGLGEAVAPAKAGTADGGTRRPSRPRAGGAKRRARTASKRK